jgi:hypothetical protein
MDLNDLMMPVRTEEQEKIRADRQAKSEVLQRFDAPAVNNDPYSLQDTKQYLGFCPFHSDEWMSFDVWGTETAVKLITIGYPIDLNANWWDDIKGTGAVNEALRELTKTGLLFSNAPLSLFDSRTLKQFNNVYSRALRVAESAIARGKLKAIDTPLNWLAWAKSENYSIFHLDPLINIGILESAQSRIDYENCNETYREQFLQYQELIEGWQKIANVWGLTLAETPAQAEPLVDADVGTYTQKDANTYELYKNSLDALVKSGIDLKSLKVKDIFNQVRLTDKTLWSITFATFKRNVWPTYSKENNLGKQPGRPRNK